MNRYFIELSYMGTNYSGFQVQENAKTIQSEVEKALSVYFKEKFAFDRLIQDGCRSTCPAKFLSF